MQQKGLLYLSRSAQAGDVPGALHNWGVVLRDGRYPSVPQDISKAVEFFKKAAEQGMKTSMMTLGTIYAEGREGVPKNVEEARRYYTMNGSPEAHIKLAALA
jgi:TPR repeat protein